ncbi:hypothetical protein, partial [Pseudomonas sp. UBA1879]|uniref:hypothetical protein n=1 Tax=Pseudomonas sp. UBA1879 TaxID=1947305 RepID=UPI0025F628B0
INFNHLRLPRLGVSGQREANSTALQSAVNHLFHRYRFNLQTEAFRTVYFVQLVDYQGVFRFVCAGSGANYRDVLRGVKHLFEFILNSA